MANIPGTPAKHAIITDTCRSNRTDHGAFDEAVARLYAEYRACMKGHPVGAMTQFHLVLTVERPEAQFCGNEKKHEPHAWRAMLGDPESASRTCEPRWCLGWKLPTSPSDTNEREGGE